MYFKRVLKYVFQYRKYFSLNILFSTLYAFFSAVAFLSLMPMLEVLFNGTKNELKRPTFTDTMQIPSNSFYMPKRQSAEMDLLEFKTVDDLSYDCSKFSKMKINTVCLDFHGSYLTEKVSKDMATLLTSLSKVNNLKINISGTKINKNIADNLKLA